MLSLQDAMICRDAIYHIPTPKRKEVHYLYLFYFFHEISTKAMIEKRLGLLIFEGHFNQFTIIADGKGHACTRMQVRLQAIQAHRRGL